MARRDVRFELQVDGDAPATITEWKVRVGDVVADGTTLAVLEVDKATLELSAPAAGRVVQLCVEAGDEIATGAVLARIEEIADDDVQPRVAPGVRCRADCPECGARIAINGPHADVPCHECGTVSPIDPELWSSILVDVVRGADFQRVLADPWTMIVRAALELPACHNCGGTLPRPGEGAADVACGDCGLSHAVVAPPDWMREAVPQIRSILGVQRPASLQGREPTACPGCGARSTTTHPHTPIPRCAYCGADVRPPGVYAPIPRRWYLLR